MKKESILADEEKNIRMKRKINVATSCSSNDVRWIFDWNTINCNPDNLSIEPLQHSFVSLFEIGKDNCNCNCVDVTDQTSALITWPQFVQQIAIRFINYFRRIEPFECLDINDRLILIEYSIFPITLLSKCISYKRLNDCCSDDDNEHSRRQRRIFYLCGGTSETRRLFIEIIVSLSEITKQDFHSHYFLSFEYFLVIYQWMKMSLFSTITYLFMKLNRFIRKVSNLLVRPIDPQHFVP